MIPVFLQILPLVSGVMYALDQLPEKWQWLFSLNPMSAVIAGWRWAILGETAPQLGPDGGERRRRDPAVRRRARRLPQLRATFRGHDLMPNAIEAHELSKRYRIGQMQAAYGTLRDSLSRVASRGRTERATSARKSGRCVT